MSRPRSMSLAPSSTITPSTSSPSAQPMRASPPAVVSPETPPLITVTSGAPLRVQPGLELRHEALAPRAGRRRRSANRRRRGCAPPPPPGRPAPAPAASASARLRIALRAPYARDGAAAGRGRVHMSSPVIALEDVALTLMGNAGPVNILRGVTLEVAPRRDARPRRPVGLGQVVAADADGRARDRDRRAGHRARPGPDRDGRGRARPLPPRRTWAWSSSRST